MRGVTRRTETHRREASGANDTPAQGLGRKTSDEDRTARGEDVAAWSDHASPVIGPGRDYCPPPPPPLEPPLPPAPPDPEVPPPVPPPAPLPVPPVPVPVPPAPPVVPPDV